MSVPDYQYDALVQYVGCLLDIINDLPNVDEIKSTPRYKKTYNKFLDTSARWLRARVKMMEINAKRKGIDR